MQISQEKRKYTMIREKKELSNERIYMSTGMGLKIERHIIDKRSRVKKKYIDEMNREE